MYMYVHERQQHMCLSKTMLKKSTTPLARDHSQSIPQETRILPPLGHFLHFFLVLRCTLEGFDEWDVG